MTPICRHCGVEFGGRHLGEDPCPGDDPSIWIAPKQIGSGDFMIGGELWPGLSKLIEESAEVIQVGGKLMGSAGDTNHWSGDLREMLIEEIGDVMAALSFFVDHNNLDQIAIANRRDHKRALFERWHNQNTEARAS